MNESATNSPASRLGIRVMMLGLRGFPDVQGGVEKHVEQLSPLLVGFGCSIEAIVRAPYVPSSAVGWHGVRFRRLWAPRSRQFEALAHTALGICYAAWRRPDILHIHAIGPALLVPLARMFGLRVVVTHHGCDYARAKWGLVAKATLKLGESAGLRFSHGRIAVSRSLAAAMERRYRVPVTPIPNSVALPTVPHATKAIEAFGLEARRYILTVGRLVPEKRHFDLIAAFRHAGISGWKLAIVGDADHADGYSNDLKEQARQMPCVVLTGVQTGDILAELFGHAGAFALPSSHEGLPIALLEALAYGLPCIASDIPANRELELGASRYFAVGDVDQLSQRMTEVTREPFTDSDRAAQRARIAAEYDCDRCARLTLRVYLDALGERKAGSTRRAFSFRKHGGKEAANDVGAR